MMTGYMRVEMRMIEQTIRLNFNWKDGFTRKAERL
jgi:hypothetical protein